MALDQSDLHEIEMFIRPLLGQKAWGVALGVGSFVTCEFGAPTPPGRSGRIHGEWHLWVYDCVWRLESNDAVIADSNDSRPRMESAVRRLEGLALSAIDIIRSDLPETLIRFENGFTLYLSSAEPDEAEHWMLFRPDGDVLSMGPGATWSVEHGGRAGGDV
jgi:hypothetical protein